MQDHEKKIVKNWLLKAYESLKAAKINIDNELYSTAQNRIYYSIFYSIMALGYSKKFITSKHSQLLGWFNKEFIKEGIFDKELGQIYQRAYDKRTKSDYTFTYEIDTKEIKNDLANAKKFVKIIDKKLNEII